MNFSSEVGLNIFKFSLAKVSAVISNLPCVSYNSRHFEAEKILILPS